MIKYQVKLPRINQPYKPDKQKSYLMAEKNKYSNISDSKFSEKQGLYVEMPSKRLTKIKTIDPFANKARLNANSFAYVYEAGGIPCKINHNGAGTMKVQWNPGIDIEKLPYDPVLVTCFDGLLEEGYPYCALAKTAIEEMLSYQGAADKVIPLVSKLVWPLRLALQSKSQKVFASSLDILVLFSNVVGSHLNPFLKQFIVPMNKRMKYSEFREKISIVLRQLEDNGVLCKQFRDLKCMMLLKQQYLHTQIYELLIQMIESLVLKMMFSAPNSMYTKDDYPNCIGKARIYYGGKYARDVPYLIMNHQLNDVRIYLIYFHAKDEDINQASQFIFDIQQYLKVNAIIIEYAGYGIYQNIKPTDKIIEQDAIQVFDHIQEKYKLKNNQIIVFGRSIGTGPAFYINSLRQFRALVVLSPFISIKTIAKEKTFEWIANMIPDKFNNIERCKCGKSPVLFIHGADDEIVNVKHTETLFDSLPEMIKDRSLKCIRLDMTHNDYIFEHDIITPMQQFFPDLCISHPFRY